MERRIQHRRWQDLFSTALNSSTAGMYITQNGKLVICNPKFVEITGYGMDELRGRHSLGLILPADRDAARNNAISMLKGQSQIPYEFRIATRDSEVKWVMEIVAPVTFQGKQAVLGNFMDITKLKQAQDRLRESERNYRAVFETMTEGLVLIIPDGQIVQANPAAERILGLNLTDIKGRKYDSPQGKILRPDGTPMAPKEMAGHRAMKEKRSITDDVMGVKHSNGVIFWISVNAEPLLDEAGGLKGIVCTFRDITERKLAEEALRASEEKYRALVENINDILYTVDTQGNITYISPAVERFTKYKVSDLIGKPFAPLIYPDDLPGLLDSFNRLMSGQMESWEFRVLDKDGRIIFMCSSSRPQYKDGQIVGITGLMTNITERKQAEDQRDIALEKYRVLFQSFPLGITITDAAGIIVEANKESEHLLGLTHDVHIQRKYDDTEWHFVHMDGTPMLPVEFASVRALKERRRIANQEAGLVQGEKVVRWISVTAEPIPLENYGVAITYADITDRKRAEEALCKREREFSTLVEHSPDMIVRYDTDLRYVYCNTAVERQLGFPVSTFIGKTSMELGGPAELAEFVDKALKRTLRTGQEQEVEQDLPLPSGTKHFLIHIVPERDDKGKIESILAVTRDITLRRQAEVALLENERKNRELVEQLHRLVGKTITAQEAERERICLEVHDGVAQTMASAFQYLQGMESNLPADFPYVDLIDKAKAQMKHAIQEAREVINSLQPATLKDLGLIPTLRQEMHRIEEENGWKINFDALAQRFPPAIEIGLYRIIHEAITNIKKHTHTRGVDISILNDGQYINVLIKDHGKGFDKDSPDIVKKKGIGLISMRKRAELLQGTLSIESIRGQGTTVMIKIPFDGRV